MLRAGARVDACQRLKEEDGGEDLYRTRDKINVREPSD